MTASRRLALPASFLFGAATIAFGTWGYLAAVPAFGMLDALYAAMQLVALDYSGPAQPPWQLELARYLGALTVALAVIAILAAVARDRIDRVRTRLFARRHHVLVGLDLRGLTVASGLRADGKRAVAVVEDPDSAGVRSARADGVPVVIGDVVESRTYRHAAVAHAEHVFIDLGDDSASLRAVEACLAVAPDRGPVLHVAIDSHLLWRELHRSALTWGGPGGAIEFVSLPDRMAARLVEEVRGNLASGWIVIWGAGRTAARTAVHAFRWVLLDGGEPTLTLAGPHAEALLAELQRTEPWVAQRADVMAEPAGGEPAVAFGTGLVHADALAGAATLAKDLQRAVILTDVPTTSGIGALRRSGFPLDRVRLLDAKADVLGAALFEGAAREAIARARHAYYVKQDIERGMSPEENPSLRPWATLEPSLRTSNRDFATSVGARLADLGAELQPLTGPVRPVIIDEALVEELAVVEHDRWMRDLLADGWRYHAGDKDPARKLHPLLIDWDALPEKEREKDRDGIRALPEFLARVGYELRIGQRA